MHRKLGTVIKSVGLLCANLALIVACGGGSSAGTIGSPPPPPPPPPGAITVSGIATYEFPRPNGSCRGLNLDNPELRPIRQATVQLLNANGTVIIDSQPATDTGAFSFGVDPSTDYLLRIRAELMASNWNVEVRNNVDTSPSPPPLAQRPIYVLDMPFTSAAAGGTVMDVTAGTGWGGSSYTGTRAAAPFAILDAVYTSMQLILGVDATANFSPLDVFWSPDNQAAVPTNLDIGDIPTSIYDGQGSIFLLGRAAGAGADPDEFDDHIVAHEWGHFFEDALSRSDSIGGRHTFSDALDMRTAFGEAWGYAIASIALDEPITCDTRGESAGGGFSAESSTAGTDGWFNELAITRLLYDLWDTADDAADGDTSSIGFGPIYDVMTGPQSTTEAFTSIFSFATYLKQQNTGQDGFIDTLLTNTGINAANLDIWGSNEVNDGPGTPDDVLPVYTPLQLGGAAVNICVNSQFDSGRDGNKLSEHRYLRLNLASDAQVTFSAIANPAPSQPTNGFDCTADENDPENFEHSDPDILVWRNGQLFVLGFSCTPNSEVASSNGLLAAGDYVIDLNDFRHADSNTIGSFPGRVCFDVTAN